MNRNRRQQKIQRATAHKVQQRNRLSQSIEDATLAAKKAKKGAKGIVAQMEKRGYRQHGDGWKRIPKQQEATA